MKKITEHKINGLNEALEITALDDPGQGGACHEYVIDLKDNSGIIAQSPDGTVVKSWTISFQNGPIKEFGFNGLSQESLLVIVIDRLRSFQAGPYACRDNAVALTKLEEAIMWLQRRTRDRMARGVEGTNQK